MGTVLLCSEIVGLASALKNLLPLVTFHQVSHQELHNDDYGTTTAPPVALVADNQHIVAAVMYQENSPFKFIQGTWAGVEPVIRHLRPDKVPKMPICRFANNKFSHMMADYAVGQVIAWERNFRAMDMRQQEHTWTTSASASYRTLSQLKIGVLGLGQIGKQVAKSFKALGSEVWGLVRSMPDQPDEDNIDYYCIMGSTNDNLHKLLANCDYICNVLPHTSQTEGLLGNGVLSSCRVEDKKTVLVNVGRATVIQDVDLLEALDNNWISGAVLDVFYEEPLPKEHVFWSHPQIVITPHVSAISDPCDIARCFRENYERIMSGQPVLNTINWQNNY